MQNNTAQGDSAFKGVSLYDLIHLSLNNSPDQRKDSENVTQSTHQNMLQFFQDAIMRNSVKIDNIMHNSQAHKGNQQEYLHTDMEGHHFTEPLDLQENRHYLDLKCAVTPPLELAKSGSVSDVMSMDDQQLKTDQSPCYTGIKTPQKVTSNRKRSKQKSSNKHYYDKIDFSMQQAKQQFTPRNQNKGGNSNVHFAMAYTPVRQVDHSKIDKQLNNRLRSLNINQKTMEIQKNQRIKDQSNLKERPDKTPRDKSRLKYSELQRTKSNRENLRMASDTSAAYERLKDSLSSQDPITIKSLNSMKTQSSNNRTVNSKYVRDAKQPYENLPKTGNLTQINDTDSHYSLGSNTLMRKIEAKGTKTTRANKHQSKSNAIKYEQNAQVFSQSKDVQQQKLITLRNQQIIQKFSRQPTKKQQMAQALSKLNISILQEFSRIKKPQKQALLIGKLFCIIFCTFRDPPLEETYTFDMVQQEFDKWDGIQYFLLTNPNKVLSECAMIKQRAMQKSLINHTYARSLIKLIADNEQHLKNIPNTNLKAIFELVQRTLIYVEYKHLSPKKKVFKVEKLGSNDDLLMVQDSQSNQYQTESEDEDQCQQITLVNEYQVQTDEQLLTTNPHIQSTIELNEEDFSENVAHLSQNPYYVNKLKQNYTQSSPPREIKPSHNIKHKFNQELYTEDTPQSKSEVFLPLKKSFIDEKASMIIKEIMGGSPKLVNQRSDPTGEVINLPLQVPSQALVMSERHSKKNSVQFNVQVYTDDDSKHHTPIRHPGQFGESVNEQTNSPSLNNYITKQSSNSNTMKNSSPKKGSSKKLSPTQKLIKFKNKSHKQQIMGQQIKNIQSHPEFFDKPLQKQPEVYSVKKQFSNDQAIPIIKQQKPTTPHSNTSSQPSDYQIQVMNKDIFSYEDLVSNSEETQRDQTPVPHAYNRIQVYSTNDKKHYDSDEDEREESFQLKLMKVEESKSSQTSQRESFAHNQQPTYVSSSNRNIDMKTIEELKMRRLNQVRNQGPDLNEKRDEIIKRIQQEFINNLH